MKKKKGKKNKKNFFPKKKKKKMTFWERWIPPPPPVIDHSEIHDKDVTIIDDVIATGATLNSCVQAISNSGAKSISALTIAVANPK